MATLTAYFPLTTNALDASGNGYNGTLRSATTGTASKITFSGTEATFPGIVSPISYLTGTDIIPFGMVTDYQKVAQSFVADVDSNGNINLIGFKRAATTETITVNEYAEIWSDSGGSPNAKVGSMTWNWAAATWAQWSTTVDNYIRTTSTTGLVPGTTYWLVFYKQSNNDSAYPNLYYDSAGVYGSFKRYDGANWVTVTGTLRFSIGYTDYITLSSYIPLTYNSFSVAWWEKTTSTAYEALFTANLNSSSGQIEQNLTANKIRFESYTNNAYTPTAMTTGVTISDGQWHHYCIVSDTTTFKLYTDGVETNSTTANVDAVNQRFQYIGALQGAPNGLYGKPFSGSMKEARFYEGALTPTEVEAIYDSEVETVTFTPDVLTLTTYNTTPHYEPESMYSQNIPRNGITFAFGNQKNQDNEYRENESFFANEKGDRTFPEKFFKTHGAEGEATDAILCPLLPSLKRNPENKVAMFMERDEERKLKQ